MSPVAQPIEEILDPDLPIIDTHHHLWSFPGGEPYLGEQFRADLAAGHRVVGTVHVQCFMGYREEGPEELRAVGETEFVVEQAEQAAGTDFPGMCAAIVGHADLSLGDGALPVLEAHLAAGGERFKGIRQLAMSDPEASSLYPEFSVDPELYRSAAFRAGFAHLDRLGLTFDAAVFHPQLDQVAELARTFPSTPIVVNHVGYPLGMGRFDGRHAEVRDELRRVFALLAETPNVLVKFGGFGSKPLNIDFGPEPRQPSSEAVAAVLRPYFELCLETFGPRRLVFETNYPVDRTVAPYAVLWNAFKRLSAGCSADERSRMFSQNAGDAYRIQAG